MNEQDPTNEYERWPMPSQAEVIDINQTVMKRVWAKIGELIARQPESPLAPVVDIETVRRRRQTGLSGKTRKSSEDI